LLVIQKPFQEDLQDDCDDNIDDENIVEAFEIVSDVIDVPNFYQDQPIYDQYSDDPNSRYLHQHMHLFTTVNLCMTAMK
jgi:hypothetical protein